MNLHEIKIGEELMADVYGKVTGVGTEINGKEYVELRLEANHEFFSYVRIPVSQCWRLEEAEKVSPNQIN